MQGVSSEFTAASIADGRRPTAALFVSWERNSAAGVFFTIGVSLVGGPDVIRGDGLNAAEADSFSYTEESDKIISITTDKRLLEPTYSVGISLGEMVMSNVGDRFTPGVDPVIGAYIRPLRPVKAYLGFYPAGSGIPQLVQCFAGQIVEYPEQDDRKKTVTLKANDFADALYNFSLTQAALFIDKRTDEIIASLLALYGLSSTQYVLKRGSVTIKYAFFPAGTKLAEALKKLAETELGNFYSDERGIFLFDTRKTWGDSPRTKKRWLRTEVTARTGTSKIVLLSPSFNVANAVDYSIRLNRRNSATFKLEIVYSGGSATTLDAAVATSSVWANTAIYTATPSSNTTAQLRVTYEATGVFEVDDFLATPTDGSEVSIVPNSGFELDTYPTNLIGNSGFETNTTGWAAYGTTVALSRVTTEHFAGSASLQAAVTSNSGTAGASTTASTTNGVKYFAQAYVKATAGVNLRLVATGLSITPFSAVATGDWQLLTLSGIATGSSVTLAVATTNGSATLYVDEVRFSAYAEPEGWTQTYTAGTGAMTYGYGWHDLLVSTPQITLLESQVIKQARINPDTQTIINRVEVLAEPRVVDATDQLIFSLSGTDYRRLEPGETIEFFTSYAEPATAVNAPVGGAGSGSTFSAFANSDGTGSNLTANINQVSFTTFSQASKVVMTNTGGTTAYLTVYSVYGRLARVSGNPIYVTKSDAGSQSEYGDRPYKIENNFIQTEAQAAQLAQWLLDDRKDAGNYLELTIRGIPQLQLGDRVRWKGLDYFILRVKSELTTAGGLTQQITMLRRPSYP